MGQKSILVHEFVRLCVFMELHTTAQRPAKNDANQKLSTKVGEHIDDKGGIAVDSDT